MDTLIQPSGRSISDEVLITSQLEHRPHRPPDFEGEAQVLMLVAKQQLRRPDQVLDTLLNGAMALCGAGSAGISVIEDDGRGVFTWTHLVGSYGPQVGGSTPVDWSPCGVTVARGAPQLFCRPARCFTYFADLSPAIEEGLVVPFAIHGRIIATMWIVTHDPSWHFDSEHARVVSRLAAFAGSIIECGLGKSGDQSLQPGWQRRLSTVLDDLDVTKSCLNEATDDQEALARSRLYLAEVDARIRELVVVGQGLEHDLTTSQAQRHTAEIARHNAIAAQTEAEHLVALGQTLSSEMDPARLAYAIADYACQKNTATACAFLTLEQEHGNACLMLRAWSTAGRSHEQTVETIGLLPFLPTTGSVLIVDLQRESAADPLVRLVRALPMGSEMRSVVATPVRSRSGALVGELLVLHHDPAYFSLRNEALLAPLSEVAAHSFENATRFAHERRLRLEMEEREVLARLHGDIGRALMAPVPFDQSLHDCCAAIASSLDAAFVRIWVLDESTQILVLHASAGLYTHLDGKHARIPLGAFKIGRIAQERSPHISNHVQNDPQVSDQAWARREGMVSFAGYPLVLGDEVLGVVGLFARHELTAAVTDMLATASIGIAANLDRHRKETQLTLKAVELLRSNQDLERFAAIASHDLMEPLRTISSFLSLFQSRYGNQFDERGQRYITHVTSAADRMTHLVKALLSYARLSGVSADLTEVQLALCTSEALANLSSKIEELAATIDVGILPTVGGDHALLTLLMQNLTANALKFHKPETPPHIRIHALDRGTEWEVRIEDNGIGIEPQYHEKVFGMFQRLHAIGTYEGSGIGLATCRRIIEQFRGRISIDETWNQGTCFVLAFPKSKFD